MEKHAGRIRYQSTKTVKSKTSMATSKAMYWVPRIASVGFVLFLSLFALDVFDGYSGWSAIVALMIHMLPSFVLAVLIGIAWRYELVGAITFISFAVGYIWMVGLDRPWSWYTAISGPAAIVGILFFMSWMQKKK